jgi:RNA polymerase sigma factor for flagellar operon FliA
VSDAVQTYRDLARQSRRDQMIMEHLPLVRHLVGKLTAELPAGVDVENLEAAGVLGLVEAATNYDPEREARFKTFAYLRVRGAILDELRRNCPLPQPMLEMLARVRAAYRTLPSPVSVAALARATGLSEDEISDCLAAARLTRMVSLSPDSRGWTTGAIGRKRLWSVPKRPDCSIRRSRICPSANGLPSRCTIAKICA